MSDIIDLFINQFSFFFDLIIEHIEISLLAILFATIIGGFLGVILSEVKKGSNFVLGLISILYTIPSISLLGFLIPFTGIGNTTAIIALTVYALLPMVRNTFTALNNVDKNIIEAGYAMGSTRLQVLYKVKLPLALPVIFSGFKNMITMTVALAGIASFIGAGGLGVAIYRGITTNNTSMTIIGSLLIALLALFFDLLLTIIDKLFKSKNKTKKKISLGLSSVIVLFALFSLVPKASDNVINIASKPMSEQYVLTEMLKIMIEQETDLNVNLTQGVGGGTSNIHPAMISNNFDIYPEYTGTAWNAVLKETSLYDESLFDTLNSEYKSLFNFEWIGMYGFNNTYSIAVRTELAQMYNLVTYSDLSRVSSSLVFGAEYDFFGREDGFNDLCDTYNLSFKQTKDMDIGLKYQAINNGDIDVMNIFTTDGQISVSDITVLIDDKQLYPSYLCGNVVNINTLEKHPELYSVFSMFDNLLTDSEVASMNYKVEVLNEFPYNVAYNYLETKGLIK